MEQESSEPTTEHDYHDRNDGEGQQTSLATTRQGNKRQRRRWWWSGMGLLGCTLGLVVVVVALTRKSNSSSSSSSTAEKSTPSSSQASRGRGSGSSNDSSPSCRTFCEQEPTTMSPQPTENPSVSPTSVRTSSPSTRPSQQPTSTPSQSPTRQPSRLPTRFPSQVPTDIPSLRPTTKPSPAPTASPFASPTTTPTRIAFNPGELTVEQVGLRLSTGLTARLLATTGQLVPLAHGQFSTQVFHAFPDFGATFVHDEGWIYVSNSEVRGHDGMGQGGVGAFYFDKDGNVFDYQRILDGTTANCGGGRTPWGAWISCEEYGRGQNWQVDPTGVRPAQVITLGSDGGVFESFAYDVRRPLADPAFFVTEDAEQGALQRFRPQAPVNWQDPWNILLGSGTTDFLVLHPANPAMPAEGGTFEWTLDRERAKQSAMNCYPNSEGIDVHEGFMYFVSKRHKTMMTLDLDNYTYKVESTRSGLFNAGPDQIKRILNDDHSNLLFFTEDGGPAAGIHARNEKGDYLTILESRTYFPETTGLAFSPDGRAMYVAYQGDGSPQASPANQTGYLFEIRREDGLPFNGRTLNVDYHANAATGAFV